MEKNLRHRRPGGIIAESVDTRGVAGLLSRRAGAHDDPSARWERAGPSSWVATQEETARRPRYWIRLVANMPHVWPISSPSSPEASDAVDRIATFISRLVAQGQIAQS